MDTRRWGIHTLVFEWRKFLRGSNRSDRPGRNTFRNCIPRICEILNYSLIEDCIYENLELSEKEYWERRRINNRRLESWS